MFTYLDSLVQKSVESLRLAHFIGDLCCNTPARHDPDPATWLSHACNDIHGPLPFKVLGSWCGSSWWPIRDESPFKLIRLVIQAVSWSKPGSKSLQAWSIGRLVDRPQSRAESLDPRVLPWFTSTSLREVLEQVMQQTKIQSSRNERWKGVKTHKGSKERILTRL